MTLLKDDVNGKEYSGFLVKPCPHPAVIKKYGRNGKCNVSVYTCKNCGCMKRNSSDAIVCGYEEKGMKHEDGTGTDKSVREMRRKVQLQK